MLTRATSATARGVGAMAFGVALLTARGGTDDGTDSDPEQTPPSVEGKPPPLHRPVAPLTKTLATTAALATMTATDLPRVSAPVLIDAPELIAADAGHHATAEEATPARWADEPRAALLPGFVRSTMWGLAQGLTQGKAACSARRLLWAEASLTQLVGYRAKVLLGSAYMCGRPRCSASVRVWVWMSTRGRWLRRRSTA